MRCYATATYHVDDEGRQGGPQMFALLFLYEDEAAAKAAAVDLEMDGPYLYLDEKTWLVAWESPPEGREFIKERLLSLDQPMAWIDSPMPGMPRPVVDGIRLQTNHYLTYNDALLAFGL